MTNLPRPSRRTLLRGLGGALVAAPFLSSVEERRARAMGTAAETPRRLIVMFTHYGCLTDRWFPAKSHGTLTADDFVGTSIEALAPYAQKLLLPRGIRAMNEWTMDVSLGQGNDPSLQVLGSYFTCVPVTPHSSDPFTFDAELKFNAKPTARSLDHVCAEQLSPGGEPLFLRVGGTIDSPQTAISYYAPEEMYAGVGSPREAYSALTGLFTPGEAMSPDTHAALRGKSAVDLIRADLERFQRFDMSAADRRKLEAWKELLYETGVAVASSQCTPELASSLAVTDETLDAYDLATVDRLTSFVAGELDGADLHTNLAVLSALCDQNRVIFLKYPANYIFRGLGLTSESHGISRRTGNGSITGTCMTNANDMILTIDRYYAAKFARLVGSLDSIAEGDGTLLDNCATVWFQQFSDGAACNLNNMPIIQAGGCGGYFKTGEAVNVEDGSADLHRGNSESGCAEGGSGMIGEDMKATGTPVEFGNAPINKYYCNLMNALGVKAGTDGFPLAGGREVVTHYGMYDDTTDFASGGENPPRINDPGEFEALRANT